MKVITLKQPWATLIAKGYKKYEFRSWATTYRGEILIHAGKGIDKEAMDKFKKLNLEYPTSRILAKCTIIDCLPLNDEINKDITKENPFIYGYKLNRVGYAFKLTKIYPLDIDKNIKGKLGLWEYNLTENEKKGIII